MNYIATVISNLSNGYIHLYWTDPPTFTSNDIRFKPFNVINIQLAGAYISEEMTDLSDCIPYSLWQQITKS